MRRNAPAILIVAALLILWELLVRSAHATIVPTPWAVAKGLRELAVKGLVLKYVVASLFRVSWGFFAATLVAVPLGLVLGWRPGANWALNPVFQVLRPISPIAWIPLAILWFGVGDPPAIFIVFLGCFFPIALSTASAVRSISTVHVQAARNFGLGSSAILFRLILPAILPRLIVALRIGLGAAWLVVIAGEMIAVNSGLGFLIVDARNAGNRYDLVFAGVVLIGATGFLLDTMVSSLARLRALRWGAGASE